MEGYQLTRNDYKALVLLGEKFKIDPLPISELVDKIIHDYGEVCEMFGNVMDTMGCDYEDMFPDEEEEDEEE